jgi:hypothetical protein
MAIHARLAIPRPQNNMNHENTKEGNHEEN